MKDIKLKVHENQVTNISNRKERVQWITSFLEAEEFQEGVDKTLGLKKNAKIYYQSIGDDRYLTFVHFCHKRPIRLQGFDPYVIKVDWDEDKPFGKSKVLSTEEFPLDWNPKTQLKQITDLL